MESITKCTPVLTKSLIAKTEMFTGDFDTICKEMSKRVKGADIIKFVVVSKSE